MPSSYNVSNSLKSYVDEWSHGNVSVSRMPGTYRLECYKCKASNTLFEAQHGLLDKVETFCYEHKAHPSEQFYGEGLGATLSGVYGGTAGAGATTGTTAAGYGHYYSPQAKAVLAKQNQQAQQQASYIQAAQTQYYPQATYYTPQSIFQSAYDAVPVYMAKGEYEDWIEYKKWKQNGGKVSVTVETITVTPDVSGRKFKG